MARISLRCPCGWSFFISASTQGHEVTCSSCGGPVPIPGREPGEEVLTPGELAARKVQQARTTKMLAGIVAGVIVIGLLLVFWFSGGDDSTSPVASNPKPSGPKYPPTYADSEQPGPPPRPDASPTAEPRVDIPFLTNEIDKLVSLSNMRGIATEALRLKGQLAARDRVLADMAADEAQIAVLLKKITDVGAAPEVQGRLMRGDKIVSFQDLTVDGRPAREGRAVLEKWLQSFTAPTNPIKVVVSRGGASRTLYIRFASQTRKLLEVARLPGTLPEDIAAMPPDPTPRPIASPTGFLLSKAVVDDVNTRLGALHPKYREFLAPGDRSRIERLLKEGEGSVDDNAFLSAFQASSLRAFEQDAGTIASTLGTLRPEALKTPDQVDVVILKSGEKKVGRILEKTPTDITLQIRIGTIVGSRTIPRSDIKKIEPGGGVAKEFPERYAKAKGNVAALESLLSWCEKPELSSQEKMTALSILEIDPTHLRARSVAGIKRPSANILASGSGRGASPVPPPRPQPSGVPFGATIRFEDKDWDPVVLKNHLQRVKRYELIEGRWYRRKEKTYTMPGLLKTRANPAVTIIPQSAVLVSDYEGVRKPSRSSTITLDASAVPQVTQERFYAPSFLTAPQSGRPPVPGRAIPTVAAPPGKELTGEVAISVRLEGPLIEASVKMRADVVNGGGLISVYVRQGGQLPTKAYDITRKEYKSRTLDPDLIRGHRQLDLVAVIKAQASYEKKRRIRKIVNDVYFEEIPVYAAKLFASNNHTTEVLGIRAVYGVPVEFADKLFAPFPQVLR